MIGASGGRVITNTYATAATIGTDEQRGRIMGLAKGSVFAGPFVGQLLLEPAVVVSSAGAGLFLLAVLATPLLLWYTWCIAFPKLAGR